MFEDIRFKKKQLKQMITSVPKDFIVSNILTHFKTIPPTVLVYNVTFRCNMRCIVCCNWKRKHEYELSPDELDQALDDDIFNRIENVGISGGEPTIRNDLPQLVRVLHRRLPRLRKISIVTNGLNANRIVPILEEIIKFANEKGFLLRIGISLDGVGELHNRVRNTPNAFQSVTETIKFLKQIKEKIYFGIGFGTTINSININDVYNIKKFCEEQKLEVAFNILRFSDSILGNVDLKDKLSYDSNQRVFISKFFKELVRESSPLGENAYLYLHWAKMLTNYSKRIMPCPFMDQGLQLNPEGSLYYCENSKIIGNVMEGSPSSIYYNKSNLKYRQSLIKTVCPTCVSPCQTMVSVRKKLYPYAGFVLYLLGLKIARWLGVVK